MAARLDRDRLARVLGLLGSAHDGEVVSAGRAADTLVRRAGLTWPDIVLQRPLPTPRPDPVPFNDAGQVQFCLRWAHRLSNWEADFVASIRDHRRPLSTKQRNVLTRVVDRLRSRAAEAA